MCLTHNNINLGRVVGDSAHYLSVLRARLSLLIVKHNTIYNLMVNITNKDIITKVAKHYNVNHELTNIIVDTEHNLIRFYNTNLVHVVQVAHIGIELSDYAIIFRAITNGDSYTFGTRWE